MWLRHWNLHRNPFQEGRSHFVPIPGHVEAVARLVHAIETGERSATLHAPAGLGKSMVLGRALAETRNPNRVVARVDGPQDGSSLLADLASSLGLRTSPDQGRARAWRRLTDAVRLCHEQGFDVVLVVNDDHHLVQPADQNDLERLVHLAARSEGRMTVLLSGIERDAEGEVARPWDLRIPLSPLTRDETGPYLDAKLSQAGRMSPTFTSQSLTRLHALSTGVPRGLDRLASLALMTAAVRGLVMVSATVVEQAAAECLGLDQAA